MPYSLHPYAYGYSAPTRWMDANGKHPQLPRIVTKAEGTYIHVLIPRNYVNSFPSSRAEYNPNAGSVGPNIYVDIVNFTTGEYFEIKHGMSPESQLREAAFSLNLEDPRSPPWQRGTRYPTTPTLIGLWPVGLDPSYNPKIDGTYAVEAWLSAAGVISYRGRKVADRGKPVVEPLPVVEEDELTNFVQNFPRARRESWNKQVRGRLGSMPPIQLQLPGLDAEIQTMCAEWLDDGTCRKRYSTLDMLSGNCPIIFAPDLQVPQLPRWYLAPRFVLAP